jgi:hypothetical protein
MRNCAIERAAVRSYIYLWIALHLLTRLCGSAQNGDFTFLHGQVLDLQQAKFSITAKTSGSPVAWRDDVSR